jgi:hypothetical protein
MTVWAWILIAAIVVVAIPAVIVTVGIVRSRRKTQRLKDRDEPNVAEFDGLFERLLVI